MGKLRDWLSRNKKRYVDLKDKCIRFIHGIALKIYSALGWVETKLQTGKIIIISAIDWAIEEVGKLKEAVNKFIKPYRIRKVVKLRSKADKISKKIAG